MTSFPPAHIHKYWILDELKKLNPKTVLDVAFAGGIGLWLYSTNLPKTKFTGSDVDEKNITEDKIKTFKSVGIELKQEDIRNLSFEDNAFELVLCDSVFNCLDQEEGEKAAKEVQRVASKHVLLLEHHSTSPGRKIHDFSILFPGVQFIRGAEGYGDPTWEEYGKLMLWTKPEKML